MKKVVNGITTVFHYSLSGQLIAESDAGGTVTAEYVYLNGNPLAKIEGSNVYYYHNDHLGTPQKMTDGAGAVVWEGEFKPFGEAISVTGTITNNLRFPGQYYDAETGLNYNYFRDYNPVIGRYVQADPIGLRGGLNLYAYVDGNPVMALDPNGLHIAGQYESPYHLYYDSQPKPGDKCGSCDVGKILKCIWDNRWSTPDETMNFTKCTVSLMTAYKKKDVSRIDLDACYDVAASIVFSKCFKDGCDEGVIDKCGKCIIK